MWEHPSEKRKDRARDGEIKGTKDVLVSASKEEKDSMHEMRKGSVHIAHIFVVHVSL